MLDDGLRTLDRGDGVRLAYRWRPGRPPVLVFLPGYASDMSGTKAEALDAWAAARGRAYLRFDYSGCGASGGAFEDGTIGRWRADAAAVIDATTSEPVVLIGSSMGGWIALLLAVALPERVAGVVGIAAAPDFTSWGLADTLTAEERRELSRTGRFSRASPYGDPLTYTRALIDDGAQHRLLERTIAYPGPVRLLQGRDDPDVPWTLALEIMGGLSSADVQLHLIKDGGHRLSRPGELALLTAVLDGLAES